MYPNFTLLWNSYTQKFYDTLEFMSQKFYDTLEFMSRVRRQNLRVGLFRSHRCLLSPLLFCGDFKFYTIFFFLLVCFRNEPYWLWLYSDLPRFVTKRSWAEP